ncbi:MAG: hypothetical protein IPK78_11115 [Rhodospirillales bacterium]|nr:hypothetical protein [Rhodospirillales bacterium]
MDAFAALESRKDDLQAACGCALDLSEPLKIDARLKADCEDESDWPRQVEWFRTTFPLFAAKVVQILEQGSLIPEAPPAA